jgi:hypothetical protein
LIARFKAKPKDFTYAELKRLLGYFSYSEEQSSGSRVIFINKQKAIKLNSINPIRGMC